MSEGVRLEFRIHGKGERNVLFGITCWRSRAAITVITNRTALMHHKSNACHNRQIWERERKKMVPEQKKERDIHSMQVKWDTSPKEKRNKEKIQATHAVTLPNMPSTPPPHRQRFVQKRGKDRSFLCGRCTFLPSEQNIRTKAFQNPEGHPYLQRTPNAAHTQTCGCHTVS